MVIPGGEKAVLNCLDHVWSHRSAHDPRMGGGGELVAGERPVMVDDEPSRGKEVYLSGHGPRRPHPVVIPVGVPAVWTARSEKDPPQFAW